jgi:hypothetical protein
VHGLFGHPYKTWATSKPKSARIGSSNPAGSRNSSTEGNVFWPKDLLPKAIPDIRVYSWGYDANIERFMSSASLNTVHQHSSNLLNDLADLRDELQNYTDPFIFIVHSLGGLIVKDALNKSTGVDPKRDSRRSRTIELTLGVIFLGTPHRGSRSASIGRRAFRVTELVAAQSSNTKLLQALEANSETLERITDSFVETLSKHDNLRIFSFSEEKEVRRLGLFGTVVVLPDSARLSHPSETTGSIPEDHRKIAKYSSIEDIGFKRVANVVKQWIRRLQKGIIGKAFLRLHISQ